MTARILDGKATSAQIRSEVAERVQALSGKGIIPGLAAVFSAFGLGFSDIADILGKTPGNVRVIYHRAIKSLESLQSSHEST